MGSEDRDLGTAWVLLLPHLLMSLVKIFNSEPKLPHLKKGGNNAYLTGML